MDVKYDFYDAQGHIKSGWSPDLLDLIWSGKSNLQRVFGDWASYIGYRNSSSGATGAFVLGNGGGNFQNEFEGTLVRGDEIYGYNRFNFKLYAGYTSEPYLDSKVVELDQLSATVYDEMGPQIQDARIISQNHILLYFDEDIMHDESTEIENYILESENGYIDINSAQLQWGRRILLYSEQIIDEEGLILTINNLTDYSGNTLEWNQINVHPLEVIPHLVGDFNDWNPENLDYEFIFNENGFWEVDIELDEGVYEYKVIESTQWNGNDWPEINQIIELSNNQDVRIKMNPGFYIGNKNGDEFVIHQNPIITGNFMDEIEGENWNLDDLTGEMYDDNDNGVFEFQAFIPAGDWEYKVALNGNWDQDTHGGAMNFNLYSNGMDMSLFKYDLSNNSTSYELIENEDCLGNGDVNSDNLINIVDVVSVVNYILGQQEFTAMQICSADRNFDGNINIADIVITVTEILE